MSNAIEIILFSPPVGVINGGIRHIFRLAQALQEQGHNVAVFEQNGQRPHWFASDVPIIGQGLITQSPLQTFIMPEDQPNILASVSQWPQRKVIYVQNHIYASLGVGDAESYADYNVHDLLCCSEIVVKWMRERHPKCRAHLLPCVIESDVFLPKSKKRIIAYMPRKRAIEAVFIKDVFRNRFPQWRTWQWQSIADMTQQQVAHHLGEAAVFLSLSRLEGLGLAPLEAMSSGCVVAGFTGGGGLEYANQTNGFWVGEDDLDACVNAIADACKMADAGISADEYQNYASACKNTLANYTKDGFDSAVRALFRGETC